jgi:hypothetical protein
MPNLLEVLKISYPLLLNICKKGYKIRDLFFAADGVH